MARVIATQNGVFGQYREAGDRFEIPDDLWRDEKRRPTWAALDGPAPTAAASTGDHSPVDVPADWRELHWAKRVALATRIAGKKPANADEADRIIAAHLGETPAAEGNGVSEALGGVAPDWLLPGGEGAAQ